MNPLRRPGLPSKEYYNDNETIVAYSKTIALVLEALLSESDPNSARHTGRLAANSESLVQDLVTFETKLAGATPAAEEAEDVTQYYNPRTLEETRSLLPQLSISYIIVGLPVFRRSYPPLSPSRVSYMYGSPGMPREVMATERRKC